MGELFSFEEYENHLDIESLKKAYLRAINFKRFYLGLRSIVDNTLNEKYLNKEGLNLFKKFSILYITILVLFVIMGIALVAKTFTVLCLLGLFITIILYAFSQIKKDILSKWTKEGRLMHEKLKRYKKFIEDLEFVNENTMLWEKHLVYATAFGIADRITEAIKKYSGSENSSLNYLSKISNSVPATVNNIARKILIPKKHKSRI
jgi:uncharacterized membrane protein